jgi:hypothetical protein
MWRYLICGAAGLLLVLWAAPSPGQDANNRAAQRLGSVRGANGDYASQDANSLAAQRQAMAKLDFLRGEWRGESWTTLASGPSRRAEEAELVERKQGGLLLTIAGAQRGASAIHTGEVVHRALAVIAYDPREKRYRLRAYAETGGYIDATAKVTAGRLDWRYRVSVDTEIRYSISLNDRGEWFEVAEVSRDGAGWAQVFEMTLHRVSAP